MNKVDEQGWVIEEDELALENSILKKHKGEYPPRREMTQESIIVPSLKEISKTVEHQEPSSQIGEKTTFFLLLIIFPYILGISIFFIFIPIFAAIRIDILFLAIDFFDWVTHFLFCSIGYITLTLSGLSLLLYTARR